ncbi:hypothetical protein NDU88_004705, partial [Pleurodeles waltl]
SIGAPGGRIPQYCSLAMILLGVAVNKPKNKRAAVYINLQTRYSLSLGRVGRTICGVFKPASNGWDSGSWCFV